MLRRLCASSLIFIVYLTSVVIFAQQKQGAVVVVQSDRKAPEALYKGSYALIIGISNYTDWNNLPGVNRDVKDVKLALEKHGFQTQTLLNPTKSNLLEGFDQFIQKYGYDYENRLLIYYAGHGHTETFPDGRELGFIIPADAPLRHKAAAEFQRKVVSIDTIESYARQIQSKHALFVFDTNFLSSKFISRGIDDFPPFIVENASQPVRQFISAGAANQSLPDDSIFRRLFVSGLEGEGDLNKDGYVLGSELANYLREKVSIYTSGRQTPQYGKINDLALDRGDFIFSLSKEIVNPNLSSKKPPDNKLPEQIKSPGISRGVEIVFADQKPEIFYTGSYALLIGVDDYKEGSGWIDLPGVKKDIKAVKAVLEKHDFIVEELLNPKDVDELDAGLRKFIKKYGFKPENRLLIYFAGHGHTQTNIDGREFGYVIPADAPRPKDDPEEFEKTAVSMDVFEFHAKQIRAKHAMFIFDSCFSGTIFSRRSQDEIVVSDFVKEKVGRKVRQFITAGSAIQRVPDESDFCKFFVRGLEGEADYFGGGDGFILGTELANYLMEKVTNYSRRRQTPQYGLPWDSELDSGDFVFPLKSSMRKKPNAESTTGALNRERMFWQDIERVNTIAGYKTYLLAYPKGEFALLAQTRITELKVKKSSRKTKKP